MTSFYDRHRIDFYFAFFLLVFLLWNAFACFVYPPLSDSWEMFYFFHTLDARPGQYKWLHILNHDPHEKIRFQPFSRCFYYFFHLLAGSEFKWFKVANVLVYYIDMLLVYFFSKRFAKSSGICAVLVFLLAFAFNHFDMVLWSSHIYILGGFGMFLLGWMHFMDACQDGARWKFASSVLLIFAGILCYESFLFWPLVLPVMARLRNDEGMFKKSLPVLCAIYLGCVGMFWLSRSLGTYPVGAREFGAFLRPQAAIYSFFQVFFNILYNGVVVRIWPFAAFPFSVCENIYMNGPFIRFIADHGPAVVFISGGACMLGLFLWIRQLFWRKISAAGDLAMFLGLLVISTWIVFFFRIGTNDIFYSLTEFRYQFVPNVFLTLCAIVVADRLWRAREQTKLRILIPVAGFVLFVNMVGIKQVKYVYQKQLGPLITLGDSIRENIKTGGVDARNKIFLPDDLPDYFPNLCWNLEMGFRFMYANYKWMFSREHIKFFTESPEQASWFFDYASNTIVRAKEPVAPGTVSKINYTTGKGYEDVRKEELYWRVGTYLLDHGKPELARKAFVRAWEINPNPEPGHPDYKSVIDALDRGEELRL